MSLEKVRLVFIFHLTRHVREATHRKFMKGESLLTVTVDVCVPPRRRRLGSSGELRGVGVLSVVCAMEVAGSLHSLPAKHSQT